MDIVQLSQVAELTAGFPFRSANYTSASRAPVPHGFSLQASGGHIQLRYRTDILSALTGGSQSLHPIREVPMDVGGTQALDPLRVSARRSGVAVEVTRATSILTRGTGFMRAYQYTLNPYSGCAFGCSYCYARFFSKTAARRDAWGNWIVAKSNAVELVDRACRSGRLSTGDTVYMSSVTDPYQPVERRLGLSRGLLETILANGVQPRLTIQTRSPHVARDIDLFRQFAMLRVNMTISTDSETVRRRYEPRCAPIEARFEAARLLVSAGIRVGISVSPMLPIVEPEAFAARLLALNAEWYGVMPLKPAGGWFVAGTSNAAIDQATADGWGAPAYRAARNTIRRILEPAHVLREGGSGFEPAGGVPS